MLNTDFYLFVYDIHDAKMLKKVVKRLDQMNSMRIQQSVFEIQGDQEEMLLLIEDVKKLVDLSCDKIAIIPLCDKDYEKTEFFGVLSRHPKEIPSFYIL